jgi:hypothetical protein
VREDARRGFAEIAADGFQALALFPALPKLCALRRCEPNAPIPASHDCRSTPLIQFKCCGDQLNSRAIGDVDADAEVYCVILLTTAFVGPHVFKASVRPKDSNAQIVARFRNEQRRLLRQNKLSEAQATASLTDIPSRKKKG